MSEKRRDKKRRLLHNGESQLPDGRYRYSYYENGKQKSFYSWKLEATDPLPNGKRDCVALRDREKQINESSNSELSDHCKEMTVYELAEKYVRLKKGVRQTTRTGYQTVLNLLSKDEFGSRPIDQIRTSDAKLWLISLQDKEKKSYSSIHTIRGVVRPAFQMAVEDDILVKNPFSFELASVLVDDSVTREALTPKQERDFLNFVQSDKHYSKYYDGIYLLLKTGLRISEFCGLTVHDINLTERYIRVDHQLQRRADGILYIDAPKTKSGIRTLPMTEDVFECCRHILENRHSPKIEPSVDGYTGFLFLDKNGMPSVAMHWEHYFKRICEKYNGIYRVQMPIVTPHVCRHTYCSNMAKSGISPKTLQYLMGHADISVTMNVYTHLGYEDAKNELSDLKAGRNRSSKHRAVKIKQC